MRRALAALALVLTVGVAVPVPALACPTEDARGCVWLAHEQGNGRGRTIYNP